MLKRYKEIIYGILLGVGAWIIDAAMHAQLAVDAHHSGSFVQELLQPGATVFVFRAVFLFIATAFGWALWRSNWRERELRAIEDAIVAFHRRLDTPTMRIVSHIRMLQGRPCVARDDVARDVAESISDDARQIDELARQYLRFSEQVAAGRTMEAIETLRGVEAWARRGGKTASSGLSDPPSF